MKREQGEAKPQESPVHDVARDEQLKVHMEKWNETMLKSIQNTSFTNATLPMPNPALMMQFAMMQMPLASLFQNQGISGKGTVADTKHDDTDDTTNNTAHDLTHSKIGRGDTNSSLPEITPLVSDLERSYSRDSRQYGGAKRAHSLPGSLPEKIGVPASQDLSMYGELDDEAYEGLDEKDIKRLKRKQSNRESARRSRLRKQAECESLQSENAALKVENERLRQENFELREMLLSLEKRTQ